MDQRPNLDSGLKRAPDRAGAALHANALGRLEAGADPDIANSWGETPLDWARESRDEEVIALLTARRRR